MKTTVDDFWTLIAEKKVQTALLLCQLLEDSQVGASVPSCTPVIFYTCSVVVVYGSVHVHVRVRVVSTDMSTWVCCYIYVSLQCVACVSDSYSQDTCHMFWPPVEGGSLEVGNMKITMVKSTATNDIDTYQFTIEKPRSVSADTASFVHN